MSALVVSFGCSNSSDRPPDHSIDLESQQRRLGGKGAGLVELASLGISVPPGFILPTDLCHQIIANGWDASQDNLVDEGLSLLADATGRRVGNPDAPLLVSVRSGAPTSMPGMMDTVLNAGLTPEIAERLGQAAGDPQFAADTMARFIRSFSTVVLQTPNELVGELLPHNASLSLEQVNQGREALRDRGFVIPDDPRQQITRAAHAVFLSWNSERALAYRQRESIPDTGTAATIQAMVFGNYNDRSGTGVAFTRHPSTGEPPMMGDFLRNAQGEDVVAGTHVTQHLTEMATLWPSVAEELQRIGNTLERHFTDMMDIEFTVEDGTLYVLQCRRGKRSARAAMRIAVDMAEDVDFPLDRDEAVRRVDHLIDNPPPIRTDHDAIDPASIIARGLAASPGVASGVLSVDIEDTIRRSALGESVILMRTETSPADVQGMAEAAGLVTTRGGMVSHAAVVAREWGLPAVVGASELLIDGAGASNGATRVEVGERVTVDGDHGLLLRGAIVGVEHTIPELQKLRHWRNDLAVHDVLGAHRTDAPVESFDVLRLLSIRGMATTEAVAGALGCADQDVAPLVAQLTETGLAQDGPGGRSRLTPDGQSEANANFEKERARAGGALEPSMVRFHLLNDDFKALVTEWQLRDVNGIQQPNDHTDPSYDSMIVERLANEIHVGIAEVLDEICIALPRLGRYRPRFAAALEAARAGDHSMMAHPLKDSYHTVWFELHEELIRLTGRLRTE